jgi:hypothetical protein
MADGVIVRADVIRSKVLAARPGGLSGLRSLCASLRQFLDSDIRSSTRHRRISITSLPPAGDDFAYLLSGANRAAIAEVAVRLAISAFVSGPSGDHFRFTVYSVDADTDYQPRIGAFAMISKSTHASKYHLAIQRTLTITIEEPGLAAWLSEVPSGAMQLKLPGEAYTATYVDLYCPLGTSPGSYSQMPRLPGASIDAVRPQLFPIETDVHVRRRSQVGFRVEASYIAEMPNLKEPMSRWYSGMLERAIELATEKKLTNQPGFALAHVADEKEDALGLDLLRLTLVACDYFHYMSANAKLGDSLTPAAGEALRDKFLGDYDWSISQPHPQFSHAFSVNLVIRLADESLLLTRRGSEADGIHLYPDHVMISMGETMSRVEDWSPGPPDAWIKQVRESGARLLPPEVGSAPDVAGAALQQPHQAPGRHSWLGGERSFHYSDRCSGGAPINLFTGQVRSGFAHGTIFRAPLACSRSPPAARRELDRCPRRRSSPNYKASVISRE